MKRTKKIICFMLTLILCSSCSVPAMAATAKYKKATKAYQTWLKKNTRSGPVSYDIVDLDGNGIPELLVSGHEDNFAAYMNYCFTSDCSHGQARGVLIVKCSL